MSLDAADTLLPILTTGVNLLTSPPPLARDVFITVPAGTVPTCYVTVTNYNTVHRPQKIEKTLKNFLFCHKARPAVYLCARQTLSGSERSCCMTMANQYFLFLQNINQQNKQFSNYVWFECVLCMLRIHFHHIQLDCSAIA